MKIAVEGMNGVGKSVVSKEIAKMMNYKYIEKPLKYFFSEMENKSFIILLNRVYEINDPLIRSCFFGLDNIYGFKNFKDNNLIIDRHLVSNFFWNGNNKSEKIFNTLIELIGVPDVTVLLYATKKTRLERIYKRNPYDHDLIAREIPVFGYDKMIYFLEKFNIPYITVNTEKKNLKQVVDEVYNLIYEKTSCKKMSDCGIVNSGKFNEVYDGLEK